MKARRGRGGEIGARSGGGELGRSEGGEDERWRNEGEILFIWDSPAK